tara:strand:+ start:43 stop:342 length:300 start_codon:yes stop_codon:yes gene_type:complete
MFKEYSEYFLDYIFTVMIVIDIIIYCILVFTVLISCFFICKRFQIDMRTIRDLMNNPRVVPDNPQVVPAELVSNIIPAELVSDIIIIRTTPQVPDLPKS